MFKKLTLQDDVDAQLVDMFHRLLGEVELPDIVQKIGGRDFLEGLFAVTLQRIPLAKKLALIVDGHTRLYLLIDRFAKLWLTHSDEAERVVLEQALSRAKLIYAPTSKS